MSSSTLDQRRFDELYAATRHELLRYLLRRAAQPADAADLLAETYVVAWRRLCDVPDGNEARLWLFGVARRLLANHRRTLLRHGLAGDLAAALEQSATHSPPADRDIAYDERAIQVREAIAALDEREREILSLSVWDGLRPAEIATVTGDTPASVRLRLHRARRRLRALLSDHDPAPKAPSLVRGFGD